MIACSVLWALLITVAPQTARGEEDDCDFEKFCPWDLKDGGFKIVTGQEVNNSWVPSDGHLGGPFTDADNNTNGHFLYLLVKNKDFNKEYHVRSPKYVKSGATCRLTFWVHMYMEQPEARDHRKFLESADKSEVINRKAQEGNIKVVIETGSNKTQWVFHEIPGNDHNRWENETVNIGSQAEFTILLVVTPSRKQPLHVALDNITLSNCFQDQQNECLPGQFQCSNNSACISYDSVCDIEKDCPDGEDEEQDCEQVPTFARCDFEDGMCGWRNKEGRDLNWKQKNGSLTVTGSTGPSFDHTYKNATGMYIYVDMTGTYKMGTASELESPIINPPPKYHSNISSPYYNSCHITFFYHKFGPHSGSLGLFLVELQREANNTQKVWWGYGTRTDKWLRTVVRLPHNITGRYYLLFEARKSYASRGDPALDDIAMSPRCFGKGVPAVHLDGYDYEKFQHGETPQPPVTHKDFVNATVYQFTTCGAAGRKGPSQPQCDEAYNNTEVEVSVQTEKIMAGIQKWIVPEGGFYTIIAKGASGGKGSDGQGVSRGALVRTVVELKKGQQLYILVGQEGTRSCPKDSFFQNFMTNRKSLCDVSPDEVPPPMTRPIGLTSTPAKKFPSKVHQISKLTFLSEGGGGGGGTYVFMMLKNKEKKPLVVAGGGGGLGHGSKMSETIHHGHGINRTLAPVTGDTIGSVPAGAGGGWRGGNFTSRETMGVSLEHGSEGGLACYKSRNGTEMGAGGFGGGGGGCTAGGGGGGYTGGRAWAYKAGLGEGGYSWIEGGFLHRVSISPRDGHGEVLIIPAIQGCDCDYLCVALDPYRATTQCLCPDNWHLSNDSVQCIMNPSTSALNVPSAFLLAIILVFLIVATVFVIFLYSRYLRKKNAMIRRKMLSGPDLQLNRLRVASDSMMTEYNPNYEFGGGVYSLRDLKEIPREHLRLVKALGQGAFGEVYQGLYKHRVGDAVEMPVAVKTLPHLSTSQAETDFLMEALIMSKFNHPNIVHFIGVCFDQHPRFIVIELLAGGDLKTFLRESRPKPDRAVPLTMKDLLSCIVDVAKGCKYMEENRFIHRDIAARNCLLTSKGPGRVVKIADFGMARDIYRADYYRKGGKAMLPIKWMPPEAFLDGIFTTKTDVWSFGVLMWEVLSMGYMPYTGCANREVMQLVTNGGRLAPPTNCPPQLYGIMTQCWQPNPEERPGFGLILERLGYCMQDPDVKRAPLPVYSKPPSSERDTTIMRPSGMDDCIQPDYLIPLPGPQEWDYPDPLLASRSTQMLIESGCEPAPTAPVSQQININSTNNNNPPTVPPISKPHLNNSRIDPSVYTVSSTLKQDTEISC